MTEDQGNYLAEDAPGSSSQTDKALGICPSSAASSLPKSTQSEAWTLLVIASLACYVLGCAMPVADYSNSRFLASKEIALASGIDILLGNHKCVQMLDYTGDVTGMYLMALGGIGWLYVAGLACILFRLLQLVSLFFGAIMFLGLAYAYFNYTCNPGALVCVFSDQSHCSYGNIVYHPFAPGLGFYFWLSSAILLIFASLSTIFQTPGTRIY